jgi:hypothetical protein
MKLWNWLKNKLKCARNCKCPKCKLSNLAKNWHKSLKAASSKARDSFKKIILQYMPSTRLIKALVAIGGSFWLILTGSLECTMSILLLGWGAAELIEWWSWK